MKLLALDCRRGRKETVKYNGIGGLPTGGLNNKECEIAKMSEVAWSWAAGASVEAERWDEERREKRGSSGRPVERAGRGDVISFRERETRERVWSPKLEMGWKKTTTRPVPGDAGASLPAQCLQTFGTGCTAPRVSLTIQSLSPLFSFFRLAIAALHQNWPRGHELKSGPDSFCRAAMFPCTRVSISAASRRWILRPKIISSAQMHFHPFLNFFSFHHTPESSQRQNGR